MRSFGDRDGLHSFENTWDYTYGFACEESSIFLQGLESELACTYVNLTEKEGAREPGRERERERGRERERAREGERRQREKEKQGEP